MPYSIFASRATWASASSKELRREEAQTEEERLQIEDELWEAGYEVNEVWEREEETTPTRQRRGRR